MTRLAVIQSELERRKVHASVRLARIGAIPRRGADGRALRATKFDGTAIPRCREPREPTKAARDDRARATADRMELRCFSIVIAAKAGMTGQNISDAGVESPPFRSSFG
jgi:hypothetical protein